MKAIALRDHTVDAFNVRTKSGRKTRKDYQVKKGQVFPVVREFRITGGAYAGSRGIELLTPEGHHLLAPLDFWALALDNPTETKCFTFAGWVPANNPDYVEVITATVCLCPPYATRDEAMRIAKEACDLQQVELKPTGDEGKTMAVVIPNTHGVGVWRRRAPLRREWLS